MGTFFSILTDVSLLFFTHAPQTNSVGWVAAYHLPMSEQEIIERGLMAEALMHDENFNELYRLVEAPDG
jgi:hypothetical protein